MKETPKILIVSRLNWDDNSNSNTLTNLFDGYCAERIARIYIETKQPNTQCCRMFYQISEVSLVQRIFRRNVKTGRVIMNDSQTITFETDRKDERREQSVMSFVRHHRSFLFTLLRDFLWGLDGWKSKELEQFIKDFNPDVVWLDGSPLILMNRLNNYVGKVAGKPICTFLMDDVYTYKSCTSLLSKVYRFFLRKQVKKTIKRASHVFVASEKMKQEYDEIFSFNSTFLAKGISSFDVIDSPKKIDGPIKMVYLGNVLIGRFDSLVLLAEAIHQVNEEKRNLKFALSVYTGDYVTEKDKRRLQLDENIRLCPPVPYNEVNRIINDYDVVVFVEGLENRNNKIARLSFSTKIVDYIASGKCILAIGPSDSAPIEYLRDNDISIVATCKAEVGDALIKMTPQVLYEYATKAARFAKEKHNKTEIQKKLYKKISDITYQNH